MIYFLRRIVLLITMVTISPLSHSEQFRPGYDLPELGNQIPIEVSPGDIWQAIKDKNINLALHLLETYALEELNKKIGSEEKVIQLFQQWLISEGNNITDELNRLVNDSSKDEQQKMQEIMALIESTFVKESAPSGSLNVTLNHSMKLNLTRVSWDEKAITDECEGYSWQVYYDMYGNAYTTISYYTDFLYQYPDYYIYKVVNNEKRLLQKIQGRRVIKRSNTFDFNSNKISESIINGIGQLFQQAELKSISNGRIFYDDMYSSLYKGKNVYYEVVADLSPYKGQSCGSNATLTSIANYDQNGDYIPDFINKFDYIDALYRNSNITVNDRPTLAHQVTLQLSYQERKNSLGYGNVVDIDDVIASGTALLKQDSSETWDDSVGLGKNGIFKYDGTYYYMEENFGGPPLDILKEVHEKHPDDVSIDDVFEMVGVDPLERLIIEEINPGVVSFEDFRLALINYIEYDSASENYYYYSDKFNNLVWLGNDIYLVRFNTFGREPTRTLKSLISKPLLNINFEDFKLLADSNNSGIQYKKLTH